jgi:hypothetical protein
MKATTWIGMEGGAWTKGRTVTVKPSAIDGASY